MSRPDNPKARVFHPAEGRRIRWPDGHPVAPGGEPVPATPYFARAIADGDLVPGAGKGAQEPAGKPAAKPATMPSRSKQA